MLKAFAPNQRVWYLEGKTPQVELVEGKVVIDVYWNVWCSGCAYGFGVLEAVRQAVAELGEPVLLREHEIDRSDIKRFGIGAKLGYGTNLILINGVDVTPFGEPPGKEWVHACVSFCPPLLLATEPHRMDLYPRICANFR